MQIDETGLAFYFNILDVPAKQTAQTVVRAMQAIHRSVRSSPAARPQ